MTPALLLGDGYEWDEYDGKLLPDLRKGGKVIAYLNDWGIDAGGDDIIDWPKDLDLNDREAVKLYVESIVLTGAYV